MGHRESARARVELQRAAGAAGTNIVVTAGYAGSRGIASVAQRRREHCRRRQRWQTGRCSSRPARRGRTPAFSTIELKSSDGNSWYNARTLGGAATLEHRIELPIAPTRSRETSTPRRRPRSSPMPPTAPPTHSRSSRLQLQQGAGRLSRQAQLGDELRLGVAVRPQTFDGLPAGWRAAGSLPAISQMRSGNPLTVFVSGNRSRSQWAPSLGPGIGNDRPTWRRAARMRAPSSGRPIVGSTRQRLRCHPAGTLGSSGRGAFHRTQSSYRWIFRL